MHVAVVLGFLAAGGVCAAVVGQIFLLTAHIAYEGDTSLSLRSVALVAVPWAMFIAAAWSLPKPGSAGRRLAFLHRAMRVLALAAPAIALVFLIGASPSIQWRP